MAAMYTNRYHDSLSTGPGYLVDRSYEAIAMGPIGQAFAQNLYKPQPGRIVGLDLMGRSALQNRMLDMEKEAAREQAYAQSNAYRNGLLNEMRLGVRGMKEPSPLAPVEWLAKEFPAKVEGGLIGPLNGEQVRWLEGRVSDMRVKLT